MQWQNSATRRKRSIDFEPTRRSRSFERRHNPPVPVSETIERLAAEGGRLPGSDADRQATDYLAAELKALDREVEVDEIRVRSDHHFAHAICVAVAIVGTVVSTKSRQPA